MRTLWNITASLVLLIPACTSGEYSTTPPDLAPPPVNMTPPDMKNPACTASAQFSGNAFNLAGPFANCECRINCTGTSFSCALVNKNGTYQAETCDGIDNDCDGYIDNNPTQPAVDYQPMAFATTKGWDRNCNGIIEYGVQIAGDVVFQRDLVNLPNSACAQSAYDKICSLITNSTKCNQTAISCIDGLSCGADNQTVYRCTYNGVTMACSANANSNSGLKILCR